MTHLDVPNASIYSESVGQGPMLLCISGADGSCEIWRRFADSLKEQFTVVTWDRRGFSRSHLLGAQDYDRRIETDVDDAALLINHISPTTPATVIGNSSGAIVALKFLTTHPGLIRTLVPYEPPAAKLLPDFDDIWAQHEDIYATYRRHGMAPAGDKFAKLTHIEPAMLAAAFDSRRSPSAFSNMQYWFEREFMYYPKTELDVDGELRPLNGKLMLVNGEDSKKEPYQSRANAVLAERLGIELVFLPGEHVGHATHLQRSWRRS